MVNALGHAGSLGATSASVCDYVSVTRDYFDGPMLSRARLFWSVATRRQLERWEPIVAAFYLDLWADRETYGADIWSAEIEHHFALVAANNLLRALDLDPETSVPVDPTVRAELREVRDLHEHWDENLGVFNVTPRPVEPKHRSGKRFAERNPDISPYDWLRFSPRTGAQLSPNVYAPVIHELLDAVDADVLDGDRSFAEFIPPRAPSPWLHEDGEWWPKAAESETGSAALTDHTADHTPPDDEAGGPESA